MYEEQKQEISSFTKERTAMKEEIERLKEKFRRAEDDARHERKQNESHKFEIKNRQEQIDNL